MVIIKQKPLEDSQNIKRELRHTTIKISLICKDRQQERERKSRTNNKIVHPNPNISITALNADVLNVFIPIKRNYQNVLFNDASIIKCLQETNFKYNGIGRLWEKMAKDIPCKHQ